MFRKEEYQIIQDGKGNFRSNYRKFTVSLILSFPICIIAHYQKFFISFKRVLSFVMIPGLGKSPAEGNGKPLQYSCLENPMDGGTWWATVHGVTKSWTRLSDFTHTLIIYSFNLSLEHIVGTRIQISLYIYVLCVSSC